MSKKKATVQSLSLFEPQTQNEPTSKESLENCSDSKPSTQTKIKDACPQCGGRSLVTKRNAVETGGTNYCAAGCLSEDRTDAYYFTPKAESFDEQAEREIAKKELVEALVAETMNKLAGVEETSLQEVKTEVVGEGVQQALIETGEKWEEHWRGMPEFSHEDLQPFHTISVHFESREEMDAFAKLVQQRIDLKVRSIWYPEAEIGRYANKRYIEK